MVGLREYYIIYIAYEGVTVVLGCHRLQHATSNLLCIDCTHYSSDYDTHFIHFTSSSWRTHVKCRQHHISRTLACVEWVRGLR
jgi:hypothetical protein